MPEILKVLPPAGVATKGRILFAARLINAKNLSIPSAALMYLTPPLTSAGYEVMVSRALVFPSDSFSYKLEEVSRAKTALRLEVAEERPEFVAFPLYDHNVNYALEVARRLHAFDQSLAFVFGASFVTINPREAAEIFGAFPNSILINGEAELALPRALDSFMKGEKTAHPGVFVRKNGEIISSSFLQRVSLSPEEHEGLALYLDFEREMVGPMGGIDLVTSRGCQEGCSFCAASAAFRSQFTSWSAEKRLAVIAQADDWLRSTGWSGPKTEIGLIDDTFFYVPKRGLDFLRAYADDPLSQRAWITIQTNLGSLFDGNGNLQEEILDAMLDRTGRTFVKQVFVGVDFWSTDERGRNKGVRDRRLTEAQIREALAAFAKRKIHLHSYWLIGDEQTTINSFVKGALFLSELILDFSPYFSVDFPEPLSLYTGTKLRERFEKNSRSLPPVEQSVGEGESKIDIYSPFLTNVDLISYVYEIVVTLAFNGGEGKVGPHQFLGIMTGLVDKWKNEILKSKERQHVQRYVSGRSNRKGQKQLFAENPGLKDLPVEFVFFKPHRYSLVELLELAYICSTLPKYYDFKNNAFSQEHQRRNPDFDRQFEEQAVYLGIKR